MSLILCKRLAKWSPGSAEANGKISTDSHKIRVSLPLWTILHIPQPVPSTTQESFYMKYWATWQPHILEVYDMAQKGPVLHSHLWSKAENADFSPSSFVCLQCSSASRCVLTLRCWNFPALSVCSCINMCPDNFFGPHGHYIKKQEADNASKQGGQCTDPCRNRPCFTGR